MTKNYIVVNAEMTGQKLKEAITERGYSIRDIQYMLDLTYPQSIYKWLHGETMPSLINLYKLSQILQVPMETLLVTENIIIDKEYDY